MNRFYNFSSNIQGKTTSSVEQFVENRQMRNSLCRFVAVLLMSLSVFSYAQADTWGGTYSANWTAAGITGSGTAASPYIIDSAHKLATLVYVSYSNGNNTTGKYFSITTDIDLDNREWTFGEAKGNGFRGVLNGNGHTISNLRLIGSSSEGNGDDKGYGLFSHIGGGNSTTPAKVINLILSSPSLTINSAGTGRRYYGILAGRMYNYAIVENVKILSPVITFACNHSQAWNVGAGIGYLGSYARVKNFIVSSPTITTSGSLTMARQTRFSVGGAIGYLDATGTAINNGFMQANYADHIVVTNGNIDLSGYTPANKSGNLYNLKYDYFFVGGVIGQHKNPQKFCENIFFSGKIKSPFSTVAPCMGTIGGGDDTQMLSQQFSCEAYTGRTYDMVEGSKSSTWYYNNFKIGLDPTIIAAAEAAGKIKNYHSSNVDGENYLNVTPKTLKRHNRVEATPRQSYTVLWWTRNNNTNTASVAPADSAEWTDGEQCIYPRYDQNVTQYPSYYMYYAQGVNAGTQYLDATAATAFVSGVTKNIDNAMGANTPKDITLTVTDLNKGQRGFGKHTFSVAAEGDDVAQINHYKWYVNGVDEGAGNTKDVTPTFDKTRGYQLGSGILVYAYDSSDNILAQAAGDLPVARLRFKNSDSAGTKSDGPHTYVKDAGTKDHPYLIGCENDLRLLSEHIKQPGNMPQEKLYISGLNNGNACSYRSSIDNNATDESVGYGQAYYELDNNIDFSADSDDSPFEPIGPNGTVPYSNDGTYGNYNNNFAFVGSVDGKGFTIKNLRETWYAGYANGGAVSAWGLFSCIGSTSQYYKVGETTATKAAVRNLIIDGAVFTHDTANRSFYYPGTNASATSGNSNNCFIGPLAGIAGNYSIIENISVTNTKITDEGSSEYKLATRRLSVGGVIGRATAAISNDNSTLDNATLRYLSSDADIDIQNAEFTNLTNATQTQMFNIGGIVGSIHSNAAANTVPYPRPSVYTGKVRARNAIVGPTFGYASWSGNTNTGYLDFARHFLGKTSANASFDATGMFYSGFQIYNGTEYKDITDTYPSVTSDWGDRNIKGVSTHANSNVYTESPKDLYEYQGVNQGNYEIPNSPAVTEAFSYDALTTEEKAALKDYTWGWSAGKFTIGASGLSVYAKDTYDGNTVTEHVLKGTITTASTDLESYQWYERKRVGGTNRDVAIGENSPTYTAEQSVHNRYIYLQGTVGESSENSAVIIVPKGESITASITKTAGNVVAGKPAAPWTLTANLSTTGATPLDADALAAEGFVITYQWYKGQEGSGTPIDGATSNTLVVEAGDYETTLRYCEITVVDGSVWWDDYKAANTYKFTLTKLPANVKVVYLDPAGSGSDSNDGLTPENAVKSWHKAYSLLTPDVTWEDNIIVLMSESDGDRTIEGFRLDRSLNAQYTDDYATWYSRTHDEKEAYWNGSIPSGYATGIVNSVLWKNATITGKWENNDYSSTAKITFNSSSDFIGLNADTKFEHLTFRGHGGSGSSYDIFFCQYHSVEFGDGLKMENVGRDNSYGTMEGAKTPDFEVFGGFNGDARFRDNTNGFLGNKWDEKFPHGKEGFTMTFKSGHFGVICTTHRQAHQDAQGISGTPNMPVKCKIVVDMDRTWNDNNKTCIAGSNNADYDIGLILAGNHEGAMYGDVDINVYSGHVARIASGTLGAYRTWYAYGGYPQPGNAYFGRANTLLDPSLSRFVKPEDTRAVKNERIIITEIYGGGLGRYLGNGNINGMIFIPFYGKSSVTMNGGTFKLLPAGNTHDAEGEVFPGIFATGAGGVNGMYHSDDPISITNNLQDHPSSQRLPYWDANGSTGGKVLYGNWSTYKDMTGDRKVYIHCYNADTDDFTDLDPEDSQTTVTINDGVFGTSEKSIDGIYGGGSGYTPTYILTDGSLSYPNYRAGNIYGKEGADHPVATLTINGGEFYCTNGIFAGGRGTDYYYNTKRASNNASNYTGLGQIFGDVVLNITGGTFHCPVYGGGLGFGDVALATGDSNGSKGGGALKTLKDMARIYGTTTVNISGGTFKGNIYGGGAIANVGYGTSERESKHYSIGTKNAVTMNITGGRIAGKVFGAAMGKTNVEVTEAPDSIGNVFGNVNLVIQGDSIGSDIYGGAEKGDVYGNVTANISNVAIGGDIYGGGMGMLSGETITASADVRGSTNVTLGAGAYYVNTVGDDNHFERDYTTPHYIYGGGKDASLIGTYDSTVGSSVTSVTSGGNTTVNINNGMGTEQLTVYGAGLGANTYCNMTNININNFSRTRDVPVNVDPKWANVGLREVFGGGNLGRVFTSTNVGMKGGQVFGTVFGGGNLAPVGTLSPSSYPYGDFGTMVSLASTDAIIWGDIFGGGNKADVNGTSQVSVSQGAFAGQVFGGGKGEMTDDNTVGTPANVNGQSVVYVNGANVQWKKRWLSLFGEVGEENEKGNFKEWSGAISGAGNSWFIDKSDPEKPVFINPHNIFGGGYLACVVSDTAKVVVTNGAVPSELIKLNIWKKTFSDDNNPHFYVFGAGYGPFTQVKATDVTVGVEGYYSEDEDESTNEQWSLDLPIEGMNEATAVNDDNMTIYGNNYGIGGYTVLGVIGGGYAGLVKEDTNVKLGGTTFVHRVYGGGYGHLGEFNKLDPETNIATGVTGSIIATTKKRDNLGEVGRNTNVYVSLSKPDENGRTGGVYGDVFGGGAGVESSTPSSAVFTDYPDMGKVLGFTRVNVVENARVYGSVYGGGDVANIANSIAQPKPYEAYTTVPTDSATIVRVVGGDIFGDVFGGGKGRLNSQANNYTLLGNVSGNSFVIADTSIGTDAETGEATVVSPNIWGNIYGGGQIGDINASGIDSTPGNTNILVNGGNIGNNIYGAGEGVLNEHGEIEASADVTGNTHVTVNGGSFLWRKIAGIGGSVRSMTDNGVTREAALAIIEAKNNGETAPELVALKNDISDVFDVDNKLFVNDHNIYGGGNTVSIVGGYRDTYNVAYNTTGEHSATITVNHGMMTEALGYYDDEEWSTGALLHQLITTNNSHPQFSVLGGGYGANTTINGNTTVNVSIGKEAAYDGATDGGATQTADRASWDALMNESTGKYATDYEALDASVKNRYYGGTSGTNGLNRYIAARMANCLSIPNHTFMNIVGGGMAGLVSGNATVNVSDQTHCQNIFGGGIGILPESPVGTETYGQVTGTTTVSITGGVVESNVYGGGAGVESVDTNGDGTPDKDFPYIAAVDKTTSVSIDGTPSGTIVFGKVFGGGDVANIVNSASVATGSSVTVLGGCVYQQIFGGGSGRLNSKCVNFKNLGKVTGNTVVTIKEGAVSAPWLWNRVYGGGSYGSVAGDTHVNILGGHIGYNIFGGGFGDDGSSLDESIADDKRITSSDVTGDTDVNISGGEWCLSQMWDIANRNWMPAELKSAGVYYTSQYDPVNNKFRVNHNIYGGGNAACTVSGNTHVTMTKGMLLAGTAIGRASTNLFEEEEWKNIYNKIGSFHFSVIGGGYGEKTSVETDTYVDINIPAESAEKEISEEFIEKTPDVLKDDMYTLFRSKQSVLDVIGGGYNGKVNGDANVTISGDPYIRRIFGGSFYADVKNTKVKINSACADYIFAGGMMGNVTGNTKLIIGNDGDARNSKILLCDDIYGGNDVSGQVNGQIEVNIYGGKIYHNVYGAGNGNYLYALNEERTKVAAVEDYEVDGAIYPLVYEVPRRPILMPASAESSSEAARLVNINSYRPLSQNIELNIKGSESSPTVGGDATARVKILGKVFGGGNTATVTMLDGTNDPRVSVNIGNYVNIKEVFMGADGEAMFDESTTGTLNAFKRINNIELSDGINWENDPYNTAIPQTYLPLTLDERVKTFPHIIDLYFQPVQMSVQPILKWNDTPANPDVAWAGSISNTTIGSFFCGGNRGNMDVTPDSDGNVVNYLFPKGTNFKITDKIVGGCNNANFVRTDLGVVHEGGYLLGVGGTMNMEKKKALINIKVETELRPQLDAENSNETYKGGNVYGGCYKSGTINGDIHIDVQSNIMNGLDVAKIVETNKQGKPAGNVYGGGYGNDSYVNGDIEVAFGTSAVACTQTTTTSGSGASLNLPIENAANSQNSLDLQPNDVTDAVTLIDDAGFSVNNIYGGGEFGNIKGNTTVKILNGHVTGNVSGGTYAGVQYGSTHVFVGYPEYYRTDKSGKYAMLRADKKNLNLTNATDGSKAIKQEIALVLGDFISPSVYDAIIAANPSNSSSFTPQSVATPEDEDWSNVSIKIDDAVYGGGYSLSSNYTGSGGAGTYTVRKYTEEQNIADAMSRAEYMDDPLHNGTGAGYCGNTTVLIWDNKAADNNADHIAISTNELTEGGMFGDGHLSYSEGFRAGELRGYGYATHSVLNKAKYEAVPSVEENNARLLNTIQRFDIMRLTDNCILLNGARDYTIKEVSTTPYSIARIGELQMVSTIDSTATTPFPTVAKARNYVGLMNNIHYVGAIKSSVDFDRKFHNSSGELEEISYRNKKLEYITDFYNAYPEGKKSEAEISDLPTEPTDLQAKYNKAWDDFNLRNDATSLNMIGLSSGYALKVQGTYDVDAVGTEGIYYGPVDGVIEVKLIQPIADEGGGYVYADNVHEHTDNFLESTGNFVFPTTMVGSSGQRVVDDCLLENFDQLRKSVPAKDATGSEMHYWFLTGRHYFYNLHITGYTFNSENYTDDSYVASDIKGIKFNADTSDGLTILEGANNNLVVTGIKWKHHHNVDGTDDTAYNGNCDIEDTSKPYTLRLSASTGAGTTYYTQEEGKALYYTVPRNENHVNNEGLKPGDEGYKEPEDVGFWKVAPSYTGESAPTISSPLLAIQLVDNVDNSGNNYYRDHLSRPDTLEIELRSKPEKWNTYTINLIINYVKGPSHSGNISVANCALPGEYIRLDKRVTIDSDESFAQNGEYFRIGKVNGTGDGLESGYYTFDTSGEKTSDILKNKVYVDPEGNYVMIPAYYFMNGYGVQYVYTCNNMSDNAGNPIMFPVDLDEENKLLVHNYHQMKPNAAFNVDLRLQEAVTRAANDESFAKPRIYIKNVADMQAFQQFVDTVGVAYPTISLPGIMDGEKPSELATLNVPKYGEWADFFLQNNVTVQQNSSMADGYYTTPAQFKGTFHGDGYAVNGINSNLIGNLTGEVYNLGLITGSIAGEKTGTIHTSYEYGNLKAFDMNGTAKEYSEEEFGNGTVAYNLNQYYLEARKKMLTAPSTTQADLADELAVAYVKNYYANGDYQYARQYDATSGKEYLRNNANPHYAADVSTDYDHYESYHKKTHDIDVARKVKVNTSNSLWAGMSEEVSSSSQMSLNLSLGDKRATDEAAGEAVYKPLFNADKIDAAAGATVVKNDYIFFGQGLQVVPEDHPSAIVSHDVRDMTNRVWRASGFYRTKVDQGFHFNASSDHEIGTYVSDARTTAIDFTGKRDAENSGSIPSSGMLDLDTQKVFYAPSLDRPTGYTSFNVADGVTHNLLVYTEDESGDHQIGHLVGESIALGYDDNTDESKIRGHQVIGTPATSYVASSLHLVDKEDFNAPIQFTATKAWYERDPEAETGYVEQSGRAWSSVALPYMVESATLSDGITRYRDAAGNGADGTQTSITFFYGVDNTKAENPHILNHEFWLRSLTAVNTVSGEKRATFKRPANGIDGKDQRGDAGPHGFAAYKPFIVSFPGEQFYEFNMEGQTITFGADDATITVTDDATTYDEHDGYKHYSAFLNNDGEGVYAIDVNGAGDRFEAGKAVYPFRSYLTKGSALAPNSMDMDFSAEGYILIGDDLASREAVLDGDIDRDPDGGVTTPSGLRVYGVGRRIVVVSDYATTLPVYTATGALVRVLDVRPGTATYSGFKQGVYVVDRKKIRLR